MPCSLGRQAPEQREVLVKLSSSCVGPMAPLIS
jgi:hypothetical protein